MSFNRVTASVQARNDFGKCFDFYTTKLGLVPIFGDRNGPYTSFAGRKEEEPFFAIWDSKDDNQKVTGYVIPYNTASSDTLAAIFHTKNFENDYNKLLNLGVEFIGKRAIASDGFIINTAYFRDPEGNLLSLEDGGV